MIQAESRRTFTHGFVLTEPELRRIVGSISEQFQKLSPPKGFSVTYTMTYRNGVVADTDSLDDVLSEENAGSGRIVRLRIEFEDREATVLFPKAETSIMVEFIDADAEDEPRSAAVRFLIRGKSRDWVFVTSTILEERITKIRRFSVNQLSGPGPWGIFSRWMLPVLVGFVMIFVFTILPIRSVRGTTSSALEDAWKSGKLKDPVEAIIMAERLRDRAFDRAFFSSGFLLPLALLLGSGLVLAGIGVFVTRYYPVYNFCWGDYLEVFQRKESVRKFVLVVIVLGILISLTGSILASHLHRSP
jgi:hypothetical protein